MSDLRMATRSPVRSFALDSLRRLSALACLGSAYEFAVTSFDTRWLAATVVSALVVATGASYWAGAWVEPAALPWPPRVSRWRGLVPGWTLMVLAAVCKAAQLSPRVVIWVWLAGVVWLLARAWLLSRDRPAVATAASGRWVWGCGVLVVVFAAVLRLWDIDTVPRYVHCDEGTINLIAQQFYQDPQRDWFATGASGVYAMMQWHFSLAGLGTLLFGFNLLGARVSDAALGILSVALLFDGVRRVTNLRVATVSATLLAANHCHLAYSRIGSGYIQTAFVVTLVFAIFSRVWIAPTYFNAALLGLVVALGVQTYAASVIALPLLLVVMAILLALHPARRRTLLVPLSVFAVTCVSAGAPYGVAIWKQGDQMLERSRQVSLFSEEPLARVKRDVYQTDSTVEVLAHQAWNALRGFHVGGDHQPQYGIAYPMADRYTAALMVPGAVLAVLAARQFVTINAVVFTVGYLLLGLGMQWAPGFNRTTGALPLGMVLPAIALVQCGATIWAPRGRVTRWALNLLLAAVVAVCVAANLDIYFVQYPFSRVVGEAPSEAGWVAREYASQYTIHLVNWLAPGHEGLRLVLGDLPIRLHREEDTVKYIRNAEVSGADLFIIYGEDRAARDAALERFPQARLEVFRRHPIHGPTLFLVFVGAPRRGMGS